MVINYHLIDLNTKLKGKNTDFTLFTETYNEILKGISCQISSGGFRDIC